MNTSVCSLIRAAVPNTSSLFLVCVFLFTAGSVSVLYLV